MCINWNAVAFYDPIALKAVHVHSIQPFDVGGGCKGNQMLQRIGD